MIKLSVDSVVLPDPSLTQQASKITINDLRIEGTNLQLGIEISGILKTLGNMCPLALELGLQMITDEDACNIIELNS